MSSKRIELPQGTSDTLFERYEKKASLENTILNSFADNGYRPVATPTFEYVDVFDRSNEYSDINSYRFSDLDGRLMALRCDSSSPIARLINTSLKNASFPLKIAYNQAVFKKQISHGGKRHEVSQCGVELIATDNKFNADLEMIKLAVDTLTVSGIENFKIEIGHAGLFNAVSSLLPLSRGEADMLRYYMEAKNIAALEDLLKEYHVNHPTVCKLLCEMPRLFGDIDILTSAKDMFGDIPDTAEIIETLLNLNNELKKLGCDHRVTFDLGLVQHLGYYTGIVFSGYSVGFGEAVLSGGRYDSLYAEFGESRNAVGFALNIDAVLDLKESVSLNTGRALRIALTKGRLQKDACKLMEAAGLDITATTGNTRQLIIPIENGKYELVLAKSADVITYVTHGVCDIGLVGKDTIDEQGGSFYELLDTGFGRCRFAVAAPKGFSYDNLDGTLVIASKYPKVAKNFFAAKGFNVEIIKIDGSVELAPLLGLADAIVDIVETGETLRANGLEVIEDISDISARIIANIAAMKLRKNEIEGLISRLKDKLY